MLLDITRCHCPVTGQCTRSLAEGDGRSAANQCCDMKADLATIGPEATLKARRCVGPKRRSCRLAFDSSRLTQGVGHQSYFSGFLLTAAFPFGYLKPTF